MEELKPCSKCGSKEDAAPTKNKWGNHMVMCRLCGHLVRGSTKEEAITNWNTRKEQ